MLRSRQISTNCRRAMRERPNHASLLTFTIAEARLASPRSPHTMMRQTRDTVDSKQTGVARKSPLGPIGPSGSSAEPAARSKSIPGAPIAIRLETGLVIEGRVIDHASGVPLGEVEVYALHRAGTVDRPWPGWFEAEARTDTDGRFQFSNLAPGQYTISSRGGRVPGGDPPTRTAGSGDPVTLAIEPRVVARRP